MKRHLKGEEANLKSAKLFESSRSHLKMLEVSKQFLESIRKVLKVNGKCQKPHQSGRSLSKTLLESTRKNVKRQIFLDSLKVSIFDKAKTN